MKIVNGTLTVPVDTLVAGTLYAHEKSFDIPHRDFPGSRLIYGVLEGPEHGIYFRGRTQEATIKLPQEWAWLADLESITVTLTPIGQFQQLVVKEIKNNTVHLHSEDFIDCYFLIQASRKDIPKLQTTQ